MTIVPAMAERAEHVTLLQRTPTYVVVGPGGRPNRAATEEVVRAGARASHGAAKERAAPAVRLERSPSAARTWCAS